MHCVEHLAGMNRVHPQIHQIRTQFDEFVCNRAGRCLHSITLASLTLFRTPASSIRTEWRRSAAGDRAPEQARHGRQVAVTWHRRGCPAPCPPSLPRHPCLPSAAPRPLWTRDSVAPDPPLPCPSRPAPPKLPQRAREAAPLAELAPSHPAPLRHASLAIATTDADRRRGSPRSGYLLTISGYLQRHAPARGTC